MPACSAGEIARLVDGQLHGGDPAQNVEDIASPQQASTSDVAVFFRPASADELLACSAGVIVVGLEVEVPPQRVGTVIQCPDTPTAFMRIVERLRPEPPSPQGVHPSCAVADDAKLGAGVSLGAGTVVEAGARVGEGTTIGPQCNLGAGVVIGKNCRIEAGAKILAGCRLEDHVRVGPGSVLGSRGFGYLPPGADGIRHPIPHKGGVWVGEGAEIGALCAVDRGTLSDTIIGPAARLDNLVQVGHNARISAGAVLVAQVGVSGSATVGQGAVLAGQSGVADHRRIGDGAVLRARAAAFRDVPDGAVYGGVPARPREQWLRQQATLSRLSKANPPEDGTS